MPCRRCSSRPSVSRRRWRRACTAAAAPDAATASGNTGRSDQATPPLASIGGKARVATACLCARRSGRRRKRSIFGSPMVRPCGGIRRASNLAASEVPCCCWRSHLCCYAGASGSVCWARRRIPPPAARLSPQWRPCSTSRVAKRLRPRPRCRAMRPSCCSAISWPPLRNIRTQVARFAALPAAGHILQLLDPAERNCLSRAVSVFAASLGARAS